MSTSVLISRKRRRGLPTTSIFSCESVRKRANNAYSPYSVGPVVFLGADNVNDDDGNNGKELRRKSISANFDTGLSTATRARRGTPVPPNQYERVMEKGREEWKFVVPGNEEKGGDPYYHNDNQHGRYDQYDLNNNGFQADDRSQQEERREFVPENGTRGTSSAPPLHLRQSLPVNSNNNNNQYSQRNCPFFPEPSATLLLEQFQSCQEKVEGSGTADRKTKGCYRQPFVNEGSNSTTNNKSGLSHNNNNNNYNNRNCHYRRDVSRTHHKRRSCTAGGGGGDDGCSDSSFCTTSTAIVLVNDGDDTINRISSSPVEKFHINGNRITPDQRRRSLCDNAVVVNRLISPVEIVLGRTVKMCQFLVPLLYSKSARDTYKRRNVFTPLCNLLVLLCLIPCISSCHQVKAHEAAVPPGLTSPHSSADKIISGGGGDDGSDKSSVDMSSSPPFPVKPAAAEGSLSLSGTAAVTEKITSDTDPTTSSFDLFHHGHLLDKRSSNDGGGGGAAPGASGGAVNNSNEDNTGSQAILINDEEGGDVGNGSVIVPTDINKSIQFTPNSDSFNNPASEGDTASLVMEQLWSNRTLADDDMIEETKGSADKGLQNGTTTIRVLMGEQAATSGAANAKNRKPVSPMERMSGDEPVNRGRFYKSKLQTNTSKQYYISLLTFPVKLNRILFQTKAPIFCLFVVDV